MRHYKWRRVSFRPNSCVAHVPFGLCLPRVVSSSLMVTWRRHGTRELRCLHTAFLGLLLLTHFAAAVAVSVDTATTRTTGPNAKMDRFSLSPLRRYQTIAYGNARWNPSRPPRQLPCFI